MLIYSTNTIYIENSVISIELNLPLETILNYRVIAFAWKASLLDDTNKQSATG